MKKYFATGQDYRQFARLFLDENIQDVKYKAKYDEPQNKGKTFFQTYLLVIPENSRMYDLWQIFMFAAYLVEFVLVPYTLASSKGIDKMLCMSTDNVALRKTDQEMAGCATFWYLEIIIDIMHICNMLLIFVTAIKGDIGPISSWKLIACSYIS